MADFRGLGAVSSSLQRLLRDRMELPFNLSTVRVTVGSPPSDPAADTPTEARVNLFLYRVLESAALKNQDLMGLGHPAALGRPPLSLELFFLLTAYGSTSEDPFVNEGLSHHLLGSAMRVLHDHPILTEQLLSLQLDPGEPVLEAPLHGQFEKLRVSLDPLNLEDLSKIWTALSLPLRVAAAYRVTVVQIESQRSRSSAPVVTRRRIHVAALKQPHVENLFRTPAAGEAVGDLRVRIGDSITLEGSNFTSLQTRVKIGDALSLAPLAPLEDQRLIVTLPDHPALQPGPQVLEVRARRAGEAVQGGLDVGEVVEVDHFETSNQLVFLIVPVLSSASLAGNILTLQGQRLFHPALRSLVLVGPLVLPASEPIADELELPTPTQLKVLVPPLPPGPQQVRIRVNGAESIESMVI